LDPDPPPQAQVALLIKTVLYDESDLILDDESDLILDDHQIDPHNGTNDGDTNGSSTTISGSSTIAAVASPRGSDQDLLLKVFMRQGGANWANRANWGDDRLPLSEWAGVVTGGESAGRDAGGGGGSADSETVVGLDLKGQGLPGLDTHQRSRESIWSLIEHLLPNLVLLNLSVNSFRGKIPWESLRGLVQQGKLRKLLLGENKFEVDVEQIPGELTAPCVVSVRGGEQAPSVVSEISIPQTH
jgi:hypothetical protein